MFTNLAILMLGGGIDLLILGAFEPQSVVGLYAAASRLVMFVVTPFVIFSGVIPPIIAELHTQGKMRQLEQALRAGASLAGFPAFAVVLVVPVRGPWVLGPCGQADYREAAPILIVLSLGRLFAVWAGSAGVTLMMTGHQRAMMTITLISGALSVGGGIIAAAAFGAVGMAVTAASRRSCRTRCSSCSSSAGWASGRRCICRRASSTDTCARTAAAARRRKTPPSRSRRCSWRSDDDAVPPGAGDDQSESEPDEEWSKGQTSRP